MDQKHEARAVVAAAARFTVASFIFRNLSNLRHVAGKREHRPTAKSSEQTRPQNIFCKVSTGLRLLLQWRTVRSLSHNLSRRLAPRAGIPGRVHAHPPANRLAGGRKTLVCSDSPRHHTHEVAAAHWQRSVPRAGCAIVLCGLFNVRKEFAIEGDDDPLLAGLTGRGAHIKEKVDCGHDPVAALLVDEGLDGQAIVLIR